MSNISDYTFGGLQQRVAFRLLNDPRFVGTPGLIGLAINKGIVQQYLWNRVATSIVETQTAVLPAGSPDAGMYAMDYNLPTGTLWVDYMVYDHFPVEMATEQEIIDTGIERSVFVGIPRWFWIRDNPDGSKTAMLFGRPDRQVTIEFWGGIQPAYLVEDTDVPPMPEVFIDSIELYACWYLLQGQPEESERAAEFYKLYLAARAENKVLARIDRRMKTRRWRDYP